MARHVPTFADVYPDVARHVPTTSGTNSMNLPPHPYISISIQKSPENKS
ncbi:MAG: hypothetical protein HDS16_03670 [Bacteroides sp.]|nr:hypothetical protein [Bacteroides sp.]